MIIEKGSSQKIYYQPKKFYTAILTGYCNWLKVEDFHSCIKLHRIKNKYLVRPDQVTLNPENNEIIYLAKIERIEFHGYYQLIYLKLKNLGFLLGIQISHQIQISIGQELPISIKAHDFNIGNDAKNSW
jgi:ABC-type Fe3+/spermidine/putrescine transport system ATPase subunit